MVGAPVPKTSALRDHPDIGTGTARFAAPSALLSQLALPVTTGRTRKHVSDTSDS